MRNQLKSIAGLFCHQVVVSIFYETIVSIVCQVVVSMICQMFLSIYDLSCRESIRHRLVTGS